MGAVYEALLSYRGFIAEHDLYEVKRKGDNFNELDVGYFVSESELSQYDEDERVRYESGEKKGKLRMYEKGTFIYRLAGREREKSASYYTPEVLTKCLAKYALKELLKDKTADEILHLTVCEPAMGSAAFLNEAISQLAEAYISRKEQETGEIISYEKRFNELQKVKMFIADRNVYGVDLNPVAVELAEVSLWLNTIYEGGFVPWFNTQLVNGNSLIGARRQVYAESALTATSKGLHWYENAPERVPLGTERKKKTGYSQIYHFLLGDPGMCSYTDRFIKGLEPDNIKKMKDWNKKFTAPYSADDLVTLRRLSSIVDDLWKSQIALRKEVEEKTQDALSVFGYADDAEDSHTTIRQKDKIYSELYKSEHMRNAGPYARLKFAMDYWCSLWFWPIDKADLLPSRSEFLFDMSLILEGTTLAVLVTDIDTDKKQTKGQLSLFPTEMQQLESEILNKYEGMGTVDIPVLRKQNPRLDLAAKIAEQNHFMHWELEFADLFADRGGFDLIIGNPPWIRLEWDEQAVLSDKKPLFVLRNLTSNQTIRHRESVLENQSARATYLNEYVTISGEQQFLNAAVNYKELLGMKANLYKCFLPQAWRFASKLGVTAFIHPDGVFDDMNGGILRRILYPKLKKHFQFENELNLFEGTNDHGRMRFSLNVYRNGERDISFDIICNLFAAKTIDACYQGDLLGPIPGIKDKENNWNLTGHQGRIVHIGKKELELFATLFDGGCDWNEARIPVIHAEILIQALEKIKEFPSTLGNQNSIVMSTMMWNETESQKDGITIGTCTFPDTNIGTIYSGPHIGLSNPVFKGSRRECIYNSDYDIIDLTTIKDKFVQRFKYSPACSVDIYRRKSPGAGAYIDNYRVVMREMLNLSGERTLIPAIIPPECGHILTVFGMVLKDRLFQTEGILASLIADFYIKTVGRGHVQLPILQSLPLFASSIGDEISIRAGLLNCLNERYSALWSSEFKENFCSMQWTSNDVRLDRQQFVRLDKKWNVNYPIRTDYARRYALVEIDVLTAMALGMTLQQLKTIYRIQFPVLQSYEADTWYDANGRIVFTNNRSLTGVGYSRPEFENAGAVQPTVRGTAQWDGIMKNAPAGYVFSRTITDDTQPSGPVERTIEYVAPFDRCDREQDYETTWKFFEEKYGQLDQ